MFLIKQLRTYHQIGLPSQVCEAIFSLMGTLSVDTGGLARRSRAYHLGLIGLVVSFIGLAVTIFVPMVMDARQPPRELSDVLADTAIKIKERVTNQKAATPPPETNWRMIAIISASVVGFIGAVLGVISWIRREDLRLSQAAIGVGVIAIAFHHILAAVVVIIALALIGKFLSNFLDIG